MDSNRILLSPRAICFSSASRRNALRLLVLPLAAVLFPLLAGCSGGGDEGSGGGGAPSVSTAPSSDAATIQVSLGWREVPDQTVSGYVIHYGTSSPGSQGSCNYDRAQFFSSNAGTVGELAPNTRYFFAVSAYNGLEGPCSREVSTVTPSTSSS
jgi:hypothetical protein